MEMTLQAAADELGVSVRQAQRLATSGRLQVTRRIGRSVLVDSTSVVAASRTARGSGRRWDERTAWAAIDLLERGSTSRLDGTRLSRLKAGVAELDAGRLVVLASHRSTAARYAQTRRTREALLDEPAVTWQTDLAAESLGLTRDAARVEGHLAAGDAHDVLHRFGLVPDGDGDVVLHVSEAAPSPGRVLALLDLAERGTTREASAAETALAEVLGRYRVRYGPGGRER